MSKRKIEIKVKKSKAGLGLFANEDVKKGEFIIEYVGTILTAREANLKGGKYLFETSKNRFVDGTQRNNLARYINHSCQPNCEIEIKQGKILIFALQKIKSGEELNYDYGEEYFNAYIKPNGCKCLVCKKK